MAYGPWRSVYASFAKCVTTALRRGYFVRCLRARIWSLSIDPAYIKVHESANSWGETVDKAVGLTRGGLNTKLHASVDGLGKR